MLSVVLPAYNEEERIAATVAAVRRAWPSAEIIVVDDGSTDATALRAETAGADAVLKMKHAGKGAALQTGSEAARGEILLLLDADLGETASAAAALLEPLERNEADMAIAQFRNTGTKGGGMGLAVKLARGGIRALTGRTLQAPLSGQRAVKREVLQKTGGFEAGWGAEVGLTVAALREGFRVVEVEVAMTHRVTGRTLPDVLHRASQFLAVARLLARLSVKKTTGSTGSTK